MVISITKTDWPGLKAQFGKTQDERQLYLIRQLLQYPIKTLL